VSLAKGETAHYAGDTLRYDGTTLRTQTYRTVFVARLAILSGGREVHALIPSLNFYPQATEPIGTPSISKGSPTTLFRDLYASLQSVPTKAPSALVRLHV